MSCEMRQSQSTQPGKVATGTPFPQLLEKSNLKGRDGIDTNMTNDVAPQHLSMHAGALRTQPQAWQMKRGILQQSSAFRYFIHVLYKTIPKFLFENTGLSLGLSFNQF